MVITSSAWIWDHIIDTILPPLGARSALNLYVPKFFSKPIQFYHDFCTSSRTNIKLPAVDIDCPPESSEGVCGSQSDSSSTTRLQGQMLFWEDYQVLRWIYHLCQCRNVEHRFRIPNFKLFPISQLGFKWISDRGQTRGGKTYWGLWPIPTLLLCLLHCIFSSSTKPWVRKSETPRDLRATWRIITYTMQRDSFNIFWIGILIGFSEVNAWFHS